MSVVNHWGKWVSTEIPVTGVVSLNSLEHIDELVHGSSSVNISEIDRLAEFMREKTSEMIKHFYLGLDTEGVNPAPLMEDSDLEMPEPTATPEMIARWEEEYGDLDWSEPDTYIVGAWRQDENGKYEPGDLTDDQEFAAIVRCDSMIAQVVKSKWVRAGALCSPCYPGQVDLDTPGDYQGFDFPQWVYGELGQNSENQEEYKANAPLGTV